MNTAQPAPDIPVTTDIRVTTDISVSTDRPHHLAPGGDHP